jgi:hypothetical protein
MPVEVTASEHMWQHQTAVRILRHVHFSCLDARCTFNWVTLLQRYSPAGIRHALLAATPLAAFITILASASCCKLQSGVWPLQLCRTWAVLCDGLHVDRLNTATNQQ